MRVQLVESDCPTTFQERLNKELWSIGKKFEILEIKYSTCSTGDPDKYEAIFSAIIIYKFSVSEEK